MYSSYKASAALSNNTSLVSGPLGVAIRKLQTFSVKLLHSVNSASLSQTLLNQTGQVSEKGIGKQFMKRFLQFNVTFIWLDGVQSLGKSHNATDVQILILLGDSAA